MIALISKNRHVQRYGCAIACLSHACSISSSETMVGIMINRTQENYQGNLTIEDSKEEESTIRKLNDSMSKEALVQALA